MRPKRLGEILIEHGLLKIENLKKALEIQKKKGGLIGGVLVENRLVTEEDVVVALAEQLNYPYLAVSNFVINEEAVRAVPAELAVKYMCIPVDKMSGTLVVVMSDPSHQGTVRALERASGCRVQAFVGTLSEIEAAIGRCYKKSLKSAHTKSLGEKLKFVLRQASEERQKLQH